ncbi:MAG: preprotein translocase subunit SecA [Clostridium sp.]
MKIVNKIFKSYSDREIKRIQPLVKKINELEAKYSAMQDKELAGQTEILKAELDKGKTLDDILPEAFAVVRETSKRVLGLRHFDVQLIGGIILHQGRIAEMRTGEGKTLVETLPAYLNALTGEGVHIITVNEYLAKRDSEWMSKIFKFLGLTVGLNLNQMTAAQKRKQYACDIMYTTNNELGFDYLRDNMVIYKEDMVQKKLNYAIIDEIDSILIDESRTPLIISGRSTKSTDLYEKANNFVLTLVKKEVIQEDAKDKEQVEEIENYDYVVDLKSKAATLTEKGAKKAEAYFGLENLNELENSDIVHNINQALQAHGIMRKDIEYIVKDGEVLIVDEFTGRIMEGRRYSNGLHQAIEAKEGVKIADESKTLATITFQNFFRIYEKLSGMTGTAMTEDKEFKEIYNLDVVEVPTNLPIARIDKTDTIYKTEDAKFNAILEEIKEAHEKGQPVLVGTVSIENSEKISKMLKKEGLKHEVLNAKNHEKEAEIVAQAGKYGAITIATNMAGRGTDIMLGGNSEFLAIEDMKRNGRTEAEIQEATAYYDTEDEYILELRKEFKEFNEKYKKAIESEKEKVIEAGGLKIIGTERHDSRRIDNQLRGRSGRQGDPGESIFFLSLEDNLMKIFGGEMVSRVYGKLGADENMPIQSRIIASSLENAQKRVEGINFDSRKRTLNYDDVMNAQREKIYEQRQSVLDGEDIHPYIIKMCEDTVLEIVYTYQQEMLENELNVEVFKQELINYLTIDTVPELERYIEEKAKLVKENITESDAKSKKNKNKQIIDIDVLIQQLTDKTLELLEAKKEQIGEEFSELERVILLKIVDDKWMEHLDNMEDLKNGIGLRGYAQKDPVVQYRVEGSKIFDEMITEIKLDVVKLIMHVYKEEKAERTTTVEITETKHGIPENVKIDNNPPKAKTEKHTPIVNSEIKVGRNDKCPCGSGKKYKNCCGK